MTANIEPTREEIQKATKVWERWIGQDFETFSNKADCLKDIKFLAQALAQQRGEFEKKIKFMEDEESVQNAALEAKVSDYEMWIPGLKKRIQQLTEALESLVYSVAGTEGAKTNSELPEWYRNRLKEAKEALEKVKGER